METQETTALLVQRLALATALVSVCAIARAHGWYGPAAEDNSTSIRKATGGKSVELSFAGTYEGNISSADTTFCEDNGLGELKEARPNGGAEIVTYDKFTKRLFISKDERLQVECEDESGNETEVDIPIFRGVDVVNISNPAKPKLVQRIDTSHLGRPTSVAVCGFRRFVAVAIAADPGFIPDGNGGFTAVNGKVGLYSKYTGRRIKTVDVGALPDMVTCTPDNKKLLVANEAEPERSTYSNDPEGSVSIIDVSRGARRATVHTADFRAFNSQKDALVDAGVRIFGPTATVAQDLEPEYIGVTPDSATAFVTLQENNAVAKLDIRQKRFTDVFSLGYKDHSLATDEIRNGLDPSNRDGLDGAGARIIRPWPVLGMYQADAVAAYTVGGVDYYVTANEGDARDYDAFSEETRIKDLEEDGLPVCEGVFPDSFFDNENLGRLKTTLTPPPFTLGSDSGGVCAEQVVAYGGRSFGIYKSDGEQVFDSGDDFEQITGVAFPLYFNSADDESSFDNRSDDKGPEPEGVAIGKIADRYYAFILLERTGGVMTYDITDPHNAKFVQYINNRDFLTNTGDRAPEGIVFISADEAPGDTALIAVAHETSGTTTLFEVEAVE